MPDDFDPEALADVLTLIDDNLEDSLERLGSLLAIPSISTDPAHEGDCARAADWLMHELRELGFQASIRPTPGHPMVIGHHPGPGRHILFYGHYDVQPVDPLDLWSTDPFTPVIEDGPNGRCIRARGASDDKGQLMTFLEACRAWREVTGSLPGNLTVFFEGEEESGSPSLVPFMKDNADELRADLALICDTGLFADHTPGIVTQLRGLLGEEIVIRGPSKDLHSGMYGGAAMNPARVLVRILAGLHDDQGRVTLPGFYDGVEDLPPEIAAQWEALSFDPARFLGGVGLSTPAGEAGRSALEMIWSRPTCEINGLVSGYTGAGFKTVLPAEARAKVSFRLVPGQDPQAIRAALRAHVEAALPPDCTAEFHPHGASRAARMATDDPAFEAARQALGAEWDRPAAFVGCGGSIPIAGHFKTILDMDSMLIGFGRDDDQIHSPNEKYDLECFHKGIRSWARVLARIAG
ncbi:M20/M25/M40 family metallo-hydrolase [Phaeovulum vinaykumarii]|uniref:Acetylornithine deacetylase/Succinyl-diaminopimelate desuccinylase n=1 Tax=Phaeovulum vinaykumarii TaxID=407234 RepID=A0A1N7JSY2_9RHOB|nr:M20/M25/M40 family metallo-hydrolase [Phaeovulum vinaykumarii]SIS52462.1 Acetylornithine deacetylase/Succinyl-diaminopimelate desuccinylase [Phaeovulum vinaykumarii]SOB91228.1 acetylornithine deacetylase/succinyl-diaminopimelate desuccinylase-like protein [Phaeovulum vinaykumarii]